VATSILTSKNPDPVTGLTKTFLGWQLSTSTIQDAFTGCDTSWAAGWWPNVQPVPGTGDITTTPPTPPLWAVQFQKPDFTAVVVTEPDWIAFDGQFVWSISAADVAANYTVTVSGHGGS
jgi:hypothetical protein